MPTRASKARDRANEALVDAGSNSFTLAERRIAAQAGVAYALLEVAFQIGRVADNVPLFGPQEER